MWIVNKQIKSQFEVCFFFKRLLSFQHLGDSVSILKDIADGKHPYAEVVHVFLYPRKNQTLRSSLLPSLFVVIFIFGLEKTIEKS